jgi:hypothetical protein
MKATDCALKRCARFGGWILGLGLASLPLQAFNQPPETTSGDSSVTYSGSAAVVNFSYQYEPSTTPIVMAQTASLAPSGGFVDASTQGSMSDPYHAVSVSSGEAWAFGGCGGTIASAEATNFSMEVLGGDNFTKYTVTAACVGTVSVAAHCSHGLDLEGHCTITQLAINGTPVTVTGQANQVVTFDVWTLVLNEQTTGTDSTGGGTITTSAMHISRPSCLDGYVCQSVACVSGLSSSCDKTTECDRGDKFLSWCSQYTGGNNGNGGSQGTDARGKGDDEHGGEKDHGKAGGD